MSLKITSSGPDRRDSTAKVHISSIETPDTIDSQAMILNVDIVFRLEIKPFPMQDDKIGHQLILSVSDVDSVVHSCGFSVQHLVDLGVLCFSEDDPDFDEDVICRNENGMDLWVDTENLRQVWFALAAELESFAGTWIEPPYVQKSRHLKIAVEGMDYFNAFISPDLRHQSSIFFSRRSSYAPGTPPPDYSLPLLFK